MSSLPFGDMIGQTLDGLRHGSSAYLVVVLGMVAVIGVGVAKLRQQSRELQRRVVDRTAKLEAEIKERHQTLKVLTETEERNRLLLDSAGEGIYGLDNTGRTTFVNPAACRMLGYEADELLGQPMHRLVHYSYPDGQPYPREKCPMYAAFTDGQVHRVENEVLWRKDGSSFPVEYTSNPIRKEGELVGAVVIFNDVSERKKVERMKDEFISTVSHELRTPLTSIRGGLGLIVSGKLGDIPEQARKVLSIAYDNSERLRLLIDDLLDINKIQSVDTPFLMTPVVVDALINEAVRCNQGYAHEYGVQLHRQSGEWDHVTVCGDPHRLNQVLSNLLSNAIKFSPKGEQVVIAIAQVNNEVCVSITDHGPGIPLEFQDRIYDKFTQADSSDSRQRGGTGLGLAISKEILERHGGRIDFLSTPGEGTTFRFYLPTRPDAEC